MCGRPAPLKGEGTGLISIGRCLRAISRVIACLPLAPAVEPFREFWWPTKTFRQTHRAYSGSGQKQSAQREMNGWDTNSAGRTYLLRSNKLSYIKILRNFYVNQQYHDIGYNNEYKSSSNHQQNLDNNGKKQTFRIGRLCIFNTGISLVTSFF